MEITDTELADELVASGTGNNVHDMYAFGAFHVIGCKARDFVRDPRVSDAATHKVDSLTVERLKDGRWQAQALLNCMPTDWMVDESLPRATNMACVAALA